VIRTLHGLPRRVCAILLVLLLSSSLEAQQFVRGDSSQDGRVNLADAVQILQFLYSQGELPCADAADVNDDGFINIADPIALLGYIFGTDSPPAQPFPRLGSDPSADNLTCSSYLIKCQSESCCARANLFVDEDCYITGAAPQVELYHAGHSLAGYTISLQDTVLLTGIPRPAPISESYHELLEQAQRGDFKATLTLFTKIRREETVERQVRLLRHSLSLLKEAGVIHDAELEETESAFTWNLTGFLDYPFELSVPKLEPHEEALLSIRQALDRSRQEYEISEHFYGYVVRTANDELVIPIAGWVGGTFLGFGDSELETELNDIADYFKTGGGLSIWGSGFKLLSSDDLQERQDEYAAETSPPQQCVETDLCSDDPACQQIEGIPYDGINPLKAGSASNGQTKSDYCLADYVLHEQYCTPSGQTKGKIIFCKSGCKDNRCQPPICGDSDPFDAGSKPGYIMYEGFFWLEYEPDRCQGNDSVSEKSCRQALKLSDVSCWEYEFGADSEDTYSCEDLVPGIAAYCFEEEVPITTGPEQGTSLEAGYCLEIPSGCRDLDGLNYQKASSAVDMAGAKLGDYCQDDHLTLQEAVCSDPLGPQSRVQYRAIDCRSEFGSEYVCFRGKCLAYPFEGPDERGRVLEHPYRVPANQVLGFYDDEFTLMPSYFSRYNAVLAQSGFHSQTFVMTMNGNAFLDFFRSWRESPDGLVFWVTHGNRGRVIIGKFDDYASIGAFVAEAAANGLTILGREPDLLISAGFNPSRSSAIVSLTKAGLAKLETRQALVMYAPCHGGTTVEALPADIAYYSRGINIIKNATLGWEEILAQMLGRKGVAFMPSTKAFDNLSSLFAIENPYSGDLISLSLLDHTNPVTDIILNPVRWYFDAWSRPEWCNAQLASGQPGACYNGEDYLQVKFAAPMYPDEHTSEDPLVVLSSPDCLDARIAHETVNWLSSTLLEFHVDFKPEGSTFEHPPDCWGEVLLNARTLRDAQHPEFHLNGKEFSHAGFCLLDPDSIAEGGRGCFPLGPPNTQAAPTESRNSDHDWFWIYARRDSSDNRVYENRPTDEYSLEELQDLAGKY
jgi:hypothetical protein